MINIVYIWFLKGHITPMGTYLHIYPAELGIYDYMYPLKVICIVIYSIVSSFIPCTITQPLLKISKYLKFSI